ncbi:MAG: hypothetical protein CVV27_09355 [Candidatus Melainabacteria bacterium HGW-Melainabacteria-1]|nr:MAG: hypothetical protein CVV27_09355 [Candidatus Melainabacteria bacterium HGW-Melainabacteria-1]
MVCDDTQFPPSGSAGTDPQPPSVAFQGVNPSLTEIRQDQIQASCLRALKLTEQAQQLQTPAGRPELAAGLKDLIQTQQDLENALASLQHSGQDLTYLWWQVAELETLIYGLLQALDAASQRLGA